MQSQPRYYRLHASGLLAVRGASGQIRVTGFSDIAVLDRTAPLVTWLETQLKKINDETLFLQPTQEECEAVADLIPDHILILPLRSASKGSFGGIYRNPHFGVLRR